MNKFLVFISFGLSLERITDMLKRTQSLIHVEFKDTEENLYFGSLAAMFDDPRVKERIGISYQTFRTKGLTEDNPYENDRILIRKGALQTLVH